MYTICTSNTATAERDVAYADWRKKQGGRRKALHASSW